MVSFYQFFIISKISLVVLFGCFSTKLAFAQKEMEQSNLHDSLEIEGKNLLEKADNSFKTNYDSVIVYANEAKEKFYFIKDWENYVFSINNISSAYYYKRDLEKFKSQSVLAYSVAKSNLPVNSNQYVIAINNLSGYYTLTGNTEKAIKLLKITIKTLSESHEKDNLILARLIENLSSSFGIIGDYQTALSYAKKANDIRLNISKEHDNRFVGNLLLQVLHNKNLNDNRLALKLLLKSEAILEKENRIKTQASGKVFVLAYEHFADIYRIKKDFNSMDYYLEKLKAFYKNGQEFKKYRFYEILGDSYIDRKDWTKAIEFYKMLNMFFIEWYGEKKKVGALAESYQKLANAYNSANKHNKALEYIQPSFSAITSNFEPINSFSNPKIETLPKRTLTLNILLTKSDILYAMWMESKENAEILQHAYDQYIYLSEFIHQLRFDLLSVKSKQLISEKIVSHFEKAIEISLVLYQQTNDPKHLEQAYHFAEQNKAITLQESIQENLAKGFGGIPDTTLEIEKDMRLEIAFYEKQIYEEKLKGEKTNEEHLKTFESTLFDLKRDYERLVEQLEKEYPKYYELKYKTELPKVAAIQAKLSNGSALIEFFSGEETIYAFVFTKEQLEVIELPKAEGLTDQISQFKDLINNPPVNDRAQKDFQDFTQMGFDLFENILQKPLSILPKSIQQLILIPDGELTYIPFEILLKDLTDKERVNYSLDNLSYLMEDYQVSYSFSSKLWLKNMGQLGGQAKEPFLGFAPVFGQAIADARRDCSADELYSLNCNKEEINTVHDMFGGHIFTDLAASKGNFEDQASNYQILHLATHACLDDENPMFNKIWLSDDYVSNNDLYNLSLNADLAVLSACNTGSGQLVKGEGVQSLARGFLHAGCPSLVTSLWSVDDCATSDIMIRFYEHLKEGNTKNKALQLAKLEYLKEADKLHQHPYYWSAFIQIGNPIALDFVGLNWTFIFVGLGILIVLFFLLKRKSKIEI